MKSKRLPAAPPSTGCTLPVTGRCVRNEMLPKHKRTVFLQKEIEKTAEKLAKTWNTRAWSGHSQGWMVKRWSTCVFGNHSSFFPHNFGPGPHDDHHFASATLVTTARYEKYAQLHRKIFQAVGNHSGTFTIWTTR